MASETPASDHTVPPSQEEEVVKELQSKLASDPVLEKPDEVKAALLSGDKPVVDPPTEELVNKDKRVVPPEAAAEKPEDKLVEVPKDEVQEGLGVAPELSGPPEEKIEECKIVHEPIPAEVEKKIEDAPAEVEKKTEDAAIAKDVHAPDESIGSEVEKNIEFDCSISEEKHGPEPDEKENLEESKVEPVVNVSPKKAESEPADKQVQESKVEPVEIESQERPEPEPAEKTIVEESKVKPVEPTEAAEVSAAACKPEVALVEQVPEVDDIKLLKEKEASAIESSDHVNESYPTDKLVEKAAEQGDLPRELAEEPTEIKGSSEDKDSKPKDEEKGIIAEDLVPCDEKVTGDVVNFTPEKTGHQGNEPRELAAETVEMRGSSDDKAVEPEKVEPKAEEKSVVAEESLQCAEKPAEAVIYSAHPSQPAEKSGEAIVTSRDIDFEAENGKNKDATADLAETENNVETPKAKEDKEVIKEKTETEGKAEPEATVQPIEAKTEEEKQIEEPAKHDIQQSECNKDSDETKTTEVHKGDVKPQKQSIVKMVKQSLVKAKKAIIGKSHNSKTTASDANN